MQKLNNWIDQSAMSIEQLFMRCDLMHASVQAALLQRHGRVGVIVAQQPGHSCMQKQNKMTHLALTSQVHVHNALLCLYRSVSMIPSVNVAELEAFLNKLDPDHAERAWIQHSMGQVCPERPLVLLDFQNDPCLQCCTYKKTQCTQVP